MCGCEAICCEGRQQHSAQGVPAKDCKCLLPPTGPDTLPGLILPQCPFTMIAQNAILQIQLYWWLMLSWILKWSCLMRAHSRHYTGKHHVALQYTRSYPRPAERGDNEMYHSLYRTWDVSFKWYPEIFIFNLCTSTSTHIAVTTSHRPRQMHICSWNQRGPHTFADTYRHTYICTNTNVRIYMRAQKHTYARTYHAHIRLMSTVASPFSPYFARSFIALSSSRPTSVSTPKWSKTSCVLRVWANSILGYKMEVRSLAKACPLVSQSWWDATSDYSQRTVGWNTHRKLITAFLIPMTPLGSWLCTISTSNWAVNTTKGARPHNLPYTPSSCSSPSSTATALAVNPEVQHFSQHSF